MNKNNNKYITYNLTLEEGHKVGEIKVPVGINFSARYLQEKVLDTNIYGVATDIDGLIYDFNYDEELIIEEKQRGAFEDFLEKKNRQYKILERKYLKHGDVSVAIVKKNEDVVEEILLFFSSGKYAHIKLRKAIGISNAEIVKATLNLWKMELMNKKLERKPFQELLKDTSRKLNVEIFEHENEFKIAYSL